MGSVNAGELGSTPRAREFDSVSIPNSTPSQQRSCLRVSRGRTCVRGSWYIVDAGR